LEGLRGDEENVEVEVESVGFFKKILNFFKSILGID